MKKRIQKLSLKTEQVITLSKIHAQQVAGGIPPATGPAGSCVCQ